MSPSDDRDARVAAVYQELILDHYRRPRNHGALEHPSGAATTRNPLCGDEITLQVELDGDTLRSLRFSGQGCAISQASASIMTQLLTGRSVRDAGALAAAFTRMVDGDAAAADDPTLGEARALAGVARLPVRQKCALLAWTALTEALATHD